ncbi:ribulose-phosphate 3-epimerase [Micromonospora chalcea]|uniref:ribulose-phosphate 3-epimerase n=1 Tax=Micromonospora chalcea TaxID=1874 RepID=UPI001656D2CB|nr:ribulose-phosphate 3-epimerase [Micromonospora chalcea]MBC8991783.1 ribulose-phosphate 3-epimerase [Micromonospora chalcea]MCT2279781.1 ribulose-phosphate 3-epimerase [Micromonospora chalcea]
MSSWLDALPRDRLLLDVSLWSADLSALGAEAARISPHADLLHIDASDTHFIPEPLFFPDLLRAVRPHTDKPLHVHLMAHRPARLAGAFAAAGADLITVHAEATGAADAIRAIHDAGLPAGIALMLNTDPADVRGLLAEADAIVLIGTPLGTKGTVMQPAALTKVTATRLLLNAEQRQTPIIADGGIRQNTVASLAAAGANGVVPGSLLWASRDLAGTAAWIRTHQPMPPASPERQTPR